MKIKELKREQHKLKIENDNIHERIGSDITYLGNGNVKINEEIYVEREIMNGDDEREIYVKHCFILRHEASKEK